MFRATLIHSFAVYLMLLTFDFGHSSPQYTYSNGLFKLDMGEKGIQEHENQQKEDTNKIHNHLPHSTKNELKNNIDENHATKTARSILARDVTGSKKGPTGGEPKNDETQFENQSSKIYRMKLRRVERDNDENEDTNKDTDEEREPEEDEEDDDYGNEDPKGSMNDNPDDKLGDEGDNSNDNDPDQNSTTTDENSIDQTTNGTDGNYNPDRSNTTDGNSSANGTVPDQWDWRKHGFLTKVGNQGRGNFCWAFAASGALEGYNFIKTGQLETLSMQQLIDCDKVIEPEAKNFSGGHTVESAFKYVQKYGIETNKTYPFTEKEGNECRYDADNVVTKINNFNRTANENDMKQILVTYGPIVVVLDAGNLVQNPDAYKGGIYEGCSSEPSTEAPHAVLAVGYGTDNGKDYWILKNSWGPEFGEKGYFRLPRNINACNITMDVIYVE